MIFARLNAYKSSGRTRRAFFPKIAKKEAERKKEWEQEENGLLT